MSTQLEAQGIELIEGYGAEQIELEPDVYVIGNVITRGNPLMEAILERGLPYISGPQWLRENVLHGRWVLAVAGTHGKTTTSAMLAWILEHAGLEPGFLIGGVPQNFGVSARTSDTPFFVIEADEYDTAFFDKRSKFVHYPARTAILNNLEFDHADIFPDLAAIETQFHHFVRTLPANGAHRVERRATRRSSACSRASAGRRSSASTTRGRLARGRARRGRRLRRVLARASRAARVRWDLLGAHNRSNALAAIAAARHAGVPPARRDRSARRASRT